MRKAAATPKTVDEYLAGVAQPARSTLEKVRASIRAAAPAEATEDISYRMPVFRYRGALVGFAAFADHCSFFPMSPAVITALEKDLKKYRTSKGTIQFPADRPLPAALVKKLVKARLVEKEK
jgi:uncharacterized protein YdhG (YjbR/CyaY superfamily)